MSTPASSGYVTDVAYIPGFYPHLAPTAMRYVAMLNGVAPPPATGGFRYLELGCGLGRSLTTLAAANPDGEFIGIDVNPEHTREVAHDIEAGGLTNARIITSDFAHLPDDVGTVDFIALHGVWSWVAPAVRDDILRVATDHLAPGGLLLVSYNAMPGWAHLQPIRGILRQYAALRKGDSVQRVRDAVAYLDYMRQHKARYFEDNPGAATYVDTIRGQDARYLAHEYLNDHWTSFYFAEVAAQFAAAGLTFTGSLPVHTNFWDLCVAPGFQDLFRTTTDRLVTEAHKDFCANTMFRWDLYSKQPRLLPDITDRLRESDDLWFSVARPGITLPISVNLGIVTSTVQGPLYEALLAMLSGAGMRLSQIVADPRVSPAQPAEVARAVDAGVAMRLFDIGRGPRHVVAGDAGPPSGRYEIPIPFNSAILAAELFGSRGVPLASTLTGSALTLGDLDAAILSEWISAGPDGLPERLDALMTARQRVINHEGKPITDPVERLARLGAACEAFAATVLPRLEEQGMVVRVG